MIVTFFNNFSKRRNSTKRPTGGTEINVRLKDDCDILAPVFLLTGQHPTYNYCLWNGRYYFVNDYRYITNNLCEISCSVDVLATYKNAIGQYTAFVERAASSSAYDVMLTDAAIAASTAISMHENGISLGSVDTADRYLVLVHSDIGILLYVFSNLHDTACFYDAGQTYSALGQTVTLQQFFDSLSASGFGFVGNDVTNYMGSVMFTPYMPFADQADDLYIVSNAVHYGFFTKQSNDQIVVLNPKYYYQNFTINLSDPGNIYNDFRARDPRFSEYKIYLPGCGEFVIPSSEAGCKDLVAEVSMDFTSFAISYKIKHANGTEVSLYEGHFGTPVPVIGTYMDLFGMAQDSAGMIGSALNQNVVGEAMSGISIIQKAAEPHIVGKQSAAGNAAQAKRFQQIIFSCKNYSSKDIPTAVAGRPSHRNIQISNMSGFIKCGNASVDISGFESEKNEVNNYLNSGFYFE